MLVGTKTGELVDKLVLIADGSFGLVEEAVWACAEGKSSADLKKVVEYIEAHRETMRKQ